MLQATSKKASPLPMLCIEPPPDDLTHGFPAPGSLPPISSHGLGTNHEAPQAKEPCAAALMQGPPSHPDVDQGEVVPPTVGGPPSGPNSSAQPPPRPVDDEVLVAVMGATGSGKTTFINTVSGSQMPVSEGLRSCTGVVQVAPPFLLDGRSVTLIDTPGFNDTTKSDTQILKMIAHFLTLTYENGKKLAGLIYIHRIPDLRMCGTSTRNFRMFRELCGDSGLKNVIILTNMWGQVTKDVGEARERELATDNLFFKPVLDKGAQMLRHDHTLASAQKVLRYFFNNQPAVLQIQREIVVEKKVILQTAAGAELNRELIEQAGLYKQGIEELRQELRAALDSRDEETHLELMAEVKRLREEMGRIEGESRKLALDFHKEREELKKKVEKIDADAKRDQKRMQDQYAKEIKELQRQTELRSNQSEAKQAALRGQIEELRSRGRSSSEGGSWFSSFAKGIATFFRSGQFRR